MTDTIVTRPTASPDRTGQGTAIEQSRAVAQVLAMVQVAAEHPRSVPGAIAEMRESCKQMRLAERAAYRYNRGDGMVNGASIHLARELARCWGSIDYGVYELLRDDAHGQSEIQAFAWDVQRNTRNSALFINPHARWTKATGAKVLLDPRDIYENNANQGARRVREAIFAVLPAWFTEEAIDLCAATLEHGGGVPLPTRILDATDKFERKGVSLEQLEAKVGVEQGRWTAADLAQLAVVYGSLSRGEVRVEDEFPQRRVTLDELMKPSTAPAPEASVPGAETADVPHLDHPDGEWMEGCPGCVASSTALDQAAEAEEAQS